MAVTCQDCRRHKSEEDKAGRPTGTCASCRERRVFIWRIRDETYASGADARFRRDIPLRLVESLALPQGRCAAPEPARDCLTDMKQAELQLRRRGIR